MLLSNRHQSPEARDSRGGEGYISITCVLPFTEWTGVTEQQASVTCGQELQGRITCVPPSLSGPVLLGNRRQSPEARDFRVGTYLPLPPFNEWTGGTE